MTTTHSPQERPAARLTATLTMQGALGALEEALRLVRRSARLDYTTTGDDSAEQSYGDADMRLVAAAREVRAAQALFEQAQTLLPLPAVTEANR